jgi:hypothetical protein
MIDIELGGQWFKDRWIKNLDVSQIRTFGGITPGVWGTRGQNVKISGMDHVL